MRADAMRGVSVADPEALGGGSEGGGVVVEDNTHILWMLLQDMGREGNMALSIHDLSLSIDNVDDYFMHICGK